MASEHWFATGVLAAVCVCAGTALAGPSAADKDTARGLMAEGRADRDKGDLAAALKAFAAADAIMHVPTTGLELARTLAALGRLVEARDTALRVLRIPERENEPSPFRVARQGAAALKDELEPRIASLTIVVGGVPKGMPMQVTLDGVAVPTEQLRQPRRINPGQHKVEATAGGEASGTKQETTQQAVDIAEGASRTVELRLLGQEHPEAEPAVAEATTEPEAPPRSSSPLSPVLTYGGFGLAGAGALLGSITGLVSLSQTTGIKSSGQCIGNQCGPAEHGAIASANTMATISTVSIAAAGVGAVAGLVGLLFRGSGDHPSSAPADAPANATSRLEPWLGIGAAGVRGSF
jgi:hypothetical protein